jgi:hypothetical protein
LSPLYCRQVSCDMLILYGDHHEDTSN